MRFNIGDSVYVNNITRNGLPTIKGYYKIGDLTHYRNKYFLYLITKPLFAIYETEEQFHKIMTKTEYKMYLRLCKLNKIKHNIKNKHEI